MLEFLLELLLEPLLRRPIVCVAMLFAVVLYLCSTLIGVAPAVCALAISAWIGWRFPRPKLISLDLSRQEGTLPSTRQHAVDGMAKATGTHVTNLRQLLLEQDERRTLEIHRTPATTE